ncbi:MAG: EFR1 family ferrodoxin [Lachnospiraceae bacterium]|nr:EFR1 family ferrodoxin [Lachnospiraceae bacterium]
MIYYFTGTGNSRFAAERIAAAMNEEACNISQYIKKGEAPKFTEDGVYVFVAPCYVSAPASAMLDFIDKATFPKGVRAYFVITCAASMGATPGYAKKLSEKKGFEYMGSAQIVMPQNYIAFFKMPEAEVNRSIVEAAIPEIDSLAEKIRNGENLNEKKVSGAERVFTSSIVNLYDGLFMKTKKFHVTEGCISCGKCEKVCPLGNISMQDGKPVWGKECTHCMACINLCPKQAVEYGKGTVGKRRYPGPEASLK